MKNLAEITARVEALPRYTGTKWTNGPDEWSLAFCKRLDALAELSTDLAHDVIDAGLIVKTPHSELRRGDLIVRHWADGTKSIDVVTEVVPAPETDSLGREMGGHYVRTTNSGGQFRTVSQMWTTSATEDRIDVRRPTKILLEEADEVLAMIAEIRELEAANEAAVENLGKSVDEVVAEMDEDVEICPLCGDPLSGDLAEFVDGDGDVYHEPCIAELIAEDVDAVESHEPIQEGSLVRFRRTFGTHVLTDGGPFAHEGYEAVVREANDEVALVQFPATDDGFAPWQFVPVDVLENLGRLEADVDAAEVGECHHEEDRTVSSYWGIGTGTTIHEVVCPACGHVFAELELVRIDCLQPGDAVVSNSRSTNVAPPYWIVDSVRPAQFDDELVVKVWRDTPEGFTERDFWTVKETEIVGVLQPLHAENVERTRKRNRKILGNLALALYRGSHYVDGSGEWETEALVRDFRNGGGHLHDDETILFAVESLHDGIRDRVHAIARTAMTESVYETVLAAAPEVYSPNWADALVRTVEACDRVPPTAAFLRDAREAVLAHPSAQA